MPSPFPRSMRHDAEFDWWRGTIKLPKFDGVKVNVPGRRSTSKKIELLVEADDGGPTEAQATAYAYCLANQPKVLNACIAGVARAAKKMRPMVAPWNSPERLEELLPRTPTPSELRSRVRLTQVRITDRVKSGVAYVEYEFNCAWDEEHGLLVVLHGDRLVYAGLSGSGW